MTALSPAAAATEGVRLMRREPTAVLVWMLLWLGVLSIAAGVVASGERIAVSDHRTFRSLSDIVHGFGPFAAVFVGLFLLLWATTTVATYRAVLRPADGRYFFLRLGIDELRVVIMTVTAFILVLAFGGIPTYLLYVLLSPIMRALPSFTREIATGGALATVCVDIWLGVRLSLIAVETFAERRFHLTAYWPLARGRFWYLFVSYFLFFLMFFVLTVLFFIVGGFLFEMAPAHIGAGDWLQRSGILALAGMLAVLTVCFWVISSTLFCACQAHAFRAIVGGGKGSVAPS